MPLGVALLTSFFFFSGLCLVLHKAFAGIVRTFLESDQALMDELFGFSTMGRLVSRRPHLMNARLFMPWIPVHGVASYSGFTQAVVWMARLAGTGFCIGVVGIVASLVIVFVQLR